MSKTAAATTIEQPASSYSYLDNLLGRELLERLPELGHARFKWLCARHEEASTVQRALSERQRELRLGKQRAEAELQHFLASYVGQANLSDPGDTMRLSRQKRLERAERDLAEITARLAPVTEACSAFRTLFDSAERYVQNLPSSVDGFDEQPAKPRKGLVA